VLRIKLQKNLMLDMQRKTSRLVPDMILCYKILLCQLLWLDLCNISRMCIQYNH